MPHCGCCVISALLSCNVNRFANSFATATIYAFARIQLIQTRTGVLTYRDTHTQQTDPYSPRALFNTCRRLFLSILFTFGTCATATATGKRQTSATMKKQQVGEVTGGEPVRERKWKRTARNDRHCGTGRLCWNANAGTHTVPTVHTHTHTHTTASFVGFLGLLRFQFSLCLCVCVRYFFSLFSFRFSILVFFCL